MKKCTITLSIWLVAASWLAGCEDETTNVVSAPDNIAPLVLYSTPGEGATGLATNSSVTVTFSEPMDPATLTAKTVLLAGAAGTVAVSADKRSVTFSPDATLAPNTTHTATITTGAKDTAGNRLTSDVSWSFTTGSAPDITAPQAVSVTPAPISMGNKASTTAITMTFNEAIDCASVDAGNVKLLEGSDHIPVQIGCSGSTITVLPIPGIPTNTDLMASIGPSITDLAGNILGNSHSWNFGMSPWTRQFGTSWDDRAYDLATDGTGNIYVAGFTMSMESSDSYVSKYDVNGAAQWTSYTGGALDFALAIISDGAGNVYAAGYTYDAIDGHTSAGNSDAFVIKYGSNGSKQWSRQFGTNQYDQAHAISSDSTGNVYVAGYTSGDLDGQVSIGGGDFFITKFDQEGNKLWTRQLGTAQYDTARAIVLDDAGKIYVAGWTGGAFNGQVNAGGDDAILAKYGEDGALVWTRQIGTGSSDRATAITLDGAGNIYVGGVTSGDLDGEAGSGQKNAFVSKYGADGSRHWTRLIGPVYDDYSGHLAVDGTGNVYISGTTSYDLDGQISLGVSDLFVSKYDMNGNRLWVRLFGNSSVTRGHTIVADGAGNIFAAGYTNGSLDGLTSHGGEDAFIVKYQTDGRKR